MGDTALFHKYGGTAFLSRSHTANEHIVEAVVTQENEDEGPSLTGIFL